MGSPTAILCFFFFFFFPLFVLKITAGLLLNKTSAVLVYFGFYSIVSLRKRVGNLSRSRAANQDLDSSTSETQTEHQSEEPLLI